MVLLIRIIRVLLNYNPDDTPTGNFAQDTLTLNNMIQALIKSHNTSIPLQAIQSIYEYALAMLNNKSECSQASAGQMDGLTLLVEDSKNFLNNPDISTYEIFITSINHDVGVMMNS